MKQLATVQLVEPGRALRQVQLETLTQLPSFQVDEVKKNDSGHLVSARLTHRSPTSKEVTTHNVQWFDFLEEIPRGIYALDRLCPSFRF